MFDNAFGPNWTILGPFGPFGAHLDPLGYPIWDPSGPHLAPSGPVCPSGAVSLAITPLVSNDSNYSLRIVNLSNFWALRAPLDPLRGSPRG